MTYQHQLIRGTSRAHLLALPSELLIQEIFSCIPPLSIAACSQTCKTLRNVISTSLLLTYLRELSVAGMIDNPHCTYTRFPIAKRLEMLRERERRWLYLDPQWTRTLKLGPPQDQQQSYDVPPGHLLFGVTKPNIGDAIHSLRLPSKLAQEAVWNEVATVSQQILNFDGALEEHNLIACLAFTDIEAPSNFQVHLIDHSTGEQHSSAVAPIISVPAPDLQPDEVCGDIAVCGEHLAVTVKYATATSIFDGSHDIPSVNYMHIWDWKSGILKGGFNIELADKTEGLGIPGLTFLREDILLTPNSGENSLDVYHIPPLPLLGGPIEVIRLVTRFRLPRLAKDLVDYSIESHLSPSHCSSKLAMLQNLSTEKPFADDPGRSILDVTINLGNDEDILTFSLLIRWQYLLKRCLETLEEFTGRSPHTIYYDWDQWGPQNSRLFPVPNLPPFSMATTGSRWVSFTEVSGGDEDFSGNLPHRIEVYDFDETRIKLISQHMEMCKSARTIKFGGKLDPGPCVVLMDANSPNIYPTSKGIFAEDVYTHLPCIRTTYLEIPETSRSQTKQKRHFGQASHSPESTDIVPPARHDLSNWGGRLVDDQRIIGIHFDRDEEDFREIEILYLG